MGIKFTKQLLDEMLEKIIEEYFSDETIENGYGLWEVIEYVKALYSDEIDTLEVEKVIICKK